MLLLGWGCICSHDVRGRYCPSSSNGEAFGESIRCVRAYSTSTTSRYTRCTTTAGGVPMKTLRMANLWIYTYPLTLIRYLEVLQICIREVISHCCHWHRLVCYASTGTISSSSISVFTTLRSCTTCTVYTTQVCGYWRWRAGYFDFRLLWPENSGTRRKYDL